MSRSASSRRSLLRDRRGVSTIEFGILAAFLFLFLIATMDLARFWFTSEAVRSFTAEAVRAAQICDQTNRPTAATWSAAAACSTTNLRNVALSRLAGLDRSALTVTRAAADLSGRVRVTITTNYVFTWVIPITGSMTYTIVDDGRIEF